MAVWQSQLVKVFHSNVIIKDDTTAIVNKSFNPNSTEILIDRITKGVNNYIVETLTPQGQCKSTLSLISINSYIGH